MKVILHFIAKNYHTTPVDLLYNYSYDELVFMKECLEEGLRVENGDNSEILEF